MIESDLNQPLLTFKQNDRLDYQKSMSTKILVIDDDNDTTELLRIFLEPKSFDLTTATTGDEGIQLVRSNAPDILVIDLLNPEIEGLKILRAIRQFSSIPILILSAINKPSIAAQALDYGADDFLIKPTSKSVFIASIKKLARRARFEQIAQNDKSFIEQNEPSNNKNGNKSV